MEWQKGIEDNRNVCVKTTKNAHAYLEELHPGDVWIGWFQGKFIRLFFDGLDTAKKYFDENHFGV
jgi:hypothetical protein